MIFDALTYYVCDVVVKHVSYAIGYLVVTICTFGLVRCEGPEGQEEGLIYRQDGTTYLSSNGTRIVGVIPVFAAVAYLLGSFALKSER